MKKKKLLKTIVAARDAIANYEVHMRELEDENERQEKRIYDLESTLREVLTCIGVQ